MGWNNAGSVAVTQNSRTIIGTGTTFSTSAAGSWLWIRGEARPHEIASVDTDLQITTVDPIEMASAADLEYRIIPVQGLNLVVRERIDALIDSFDAQKAALALASAAALWVSGAAYAAGDLSASTVDFMTYRAITAHAGEATDPANDPVNWVGAFSSVSGNLSVGGDVTTSGDLYITSDSPLLRLTDTDTPSRLSQIIQNGGTMFIEARNDSAYGQIAFRGRNGAGTQEWARFVDAKFGIGLTNPLWDVHVASAQPRIYLEDTGAASTHAITSLNAEGGSFRIQSRSATGGYLENDYFITRDASGASQHVWYIGATAQARLDATGLGIGGTPSELFHVFGAQGELALANDGRTLHVGRNAAAGQASNIELGISRTGEGNALIDFHASAGVDFNSRILRATGVNGEFQFSHAGTGAMRFRTNGSAQMLFETSSTQRMRIDADGGVGIGNPTSIVGLVDVLGTGGNTQIDATGGGLYVGRNSSNVNDFIEIGRSRTVNGNAFIDFHADTTTTDFDARIARYLGPNGTFQLGQYGTGPIDIHHFGVGPIILQTSDLERMRINAAGDVVIGDTTDRGKVRINHVQFDPTDADTATLTLGQISGGVQSDGAYGNGLVFSKINSTRPGGAIAAKQTDADVDRLGLAFFTHQSNVASDDMVEQMVLHHDGQLQLLGNQTYMTNGNSRVKYGLWNVDDRYGIGMTGDVAYGFLGYNTAGGDQFATTFVMNDVIDRGWWWGDQLHDLLTEGAMSLTVDGQLYVDQRIAIGGGTSHTVQGTLTAVSTTPRLFLQDSDADSDYNLTSFTIDAGEFRLQTRNSTGTFVSHDYLIDKNASGATQHRWRIANNDKLKLTADGLEFIDDNPVIQIRDSDTANTGRAITGLRNGDGNFQIQTRDDTGAYVSNDYLIDRDDSGAILHSFRTGDTNRLLIDADAVQVMSGVDLWLDSGNTRITNNDGGGNWNLRIGHHFSSSDERFIQPTAAALMTFNDDSSAAGAEALTFKVSNNAGTSAGDPVVWAPALTLGTARLTYGGDTFRMSTARTITNSTDTGFAGDMCWDADYFYVCVASNSWKRAALSAW